MTIDAARRAGTVTRLLIGDDHAVVRDALVRVLAEDDRFRVIGEAESGEEVLRIAQEKQPDLVVMDVSMPGGDGIDAARHLRSVSPNTRVLLLTMHEDDATISRALSAGVDGYVLKSASLEELLRAICAVADGGSYLSPAVARRFINRNGRAASGRELTGRELEILRLLAMGYRAAQVAATLCVSVKTVRNHLASIYVKLQVGSATQAVAEAYRQGIVAPPRAV